MNMQRLLDSVPLKSTRDAVSTIKAIGFLGAILTGGVVTLAYLLQSHMSKQQATAVGAAGALLALITAAGCWGYVRHVKLAAPYVIVRTEGLLNIEKVNGHRRYINEKRWIIKATREDVRLFGNTTRWTGQSTKSSVRSESLNPEHYLFAAPCPEEDGRAQQWIYFGRSLFKGEEIQLGIRQTFEDDAREMIPFYREGSGPTSARELTATARFSLSDDPAVVRGLIWNKERKVCGELSVRREANHGTGKVNYIVSVSGTKPRHSYGFRWS